MGILALKSNKDLDVIIGLIETGTVNIVINKCYPLSKTAEALQYLADGHAKGKLVIMIKEDTL